MAYTETKSVGWGSRLGSSFRGMGFGILLVLAGTALLWWNEGNFVATGDALNEAQGVTQELGDIGTLNTAANGKLVHASGFADTRDTLVDPVFKISSRAIRLERAVQVYQWVEKTSTKRQKKVGGGEETVTTYTYEKEWVGKPVESSRFKAPNGAAMYANTVRMPLEKMTVQAATVSFGAYRLPEPLIRSISGATAFEVAVPEDVLAQLNQRLAPKVVAPQPVPVVQETQAAADGQQAEPAVPVVVAAPVVHMVHASSNTVYVGINPSQPAIGDVRVTFMEVRPATVSILARLNGNTFEAYRASNNKTVFKLSMGTQSMENMYGASHSSNSASTWLFRVVAVVLVVMGLRMVVAPLSVAADVIPFLGTLVGAGTGIVCLLLGLSWSFVVMALAWLRFRPLMGGMALAAAATLLVVLYMKGRSGKKAAQQ